MMFEGFRKKKGADEEIQFKPFDGTVTEEHVSVPEVLEEQAPAQVTEQNPASNIELKLSRPESFDEVSTVADHLLAGCTVFLNMELLDRETGLRMLDFLNGVTYSLGGDIRNAAPGVYIITPHNVDITD